MQRTPSTKTYYVFVEGVQGNMNSIRKAHTTVLYEDESEVMETEVKEALRHISNRKSAGCDGIGDLPIELLKGEGEEAVKVMTGLCNCIGR